MDRLELLLSSGLIAQDTCEKARKVDACLTERFGRSEKIEMFVTHYAMALERRQNEEVIEGLHEEAVAEIYKNPDFETCRLLLEELESLTASGLSATEEQFILIHLLNIVNENKNK